MGVVHQVFVSLTGDDGALRPNATEFLARFGSRQRREDGSFCFDNPDDAADAIAKAEMWHLPAHRFYQFVVDDEHIHEYPGYYLSLDVVEPLLIERQPNIRVLSEVEIAKDFDSEK